MAIVRLGIVGYAILSVVALVGSITRTCPRTAPPQAMATSAAGPGLFAVAGAPALPAVRSRKGGAIAAK